MTVECALPLQLQRHPNVDRDDAMGMSNHP